MKIIKYLLIGLIFFSGCSIDKIIRDLPNLKYNLKSVSSFKVSGTDISDKQKLSDFSVIEAVKITADVANNELPVSFIVNVEISNPSETKDIENYDDVYIKSFPWRLLLNKKETIRGSINQPISIPSRGNKKDIGIEISFNLMEYFKNNTLDELMDLLFGIGGKDGSVKKLEIMTQPTFHTSLGDFTWPEEFSVVSKEY